MQIVSFSPAFLFSQESKIPDSFPPGEAIAPSALKMVNYNLSLSLFLLRDMWGHSLLRWGFAALAAVLVWFYNGKRGRPLKWSFYIYYPAHLLALMLFKQMV